MVSEPQMTCVYVVGGSEMHYQNLSRSLRSLRERGPVCDVLVVDLNGRLRSDNHRRVISGEGLIDPVRKLGFQFWKNKYSACLHATTDYVFYLDTDTVFVNNTLGELIKKVGEGFGISKHWSVPTLRDFVEKVVPLENRGLLEGLLRDKLGVTGECEFVASGAFLFRNSPANRAILKQVLSFYEAIYPPGVDYIEGVTDEVFLSAALKSSGGAVFLSGALNHCVMGNSCMPLKYQNHVFYGRNPFEEKWEPVTLFHCYVTVDRSSQYGWWMRPKIRKALYF